jgi:hypothetical protein
MEIALIFGLLLTLVLLNVKATQLVQHDELLSSAQRIAQITLAWLIPFIGAIIVMVMQHLLSEPRRRRQEADLGLDPFALKEYGD